MGVIHLIRHGEPVLSGVLLGRADPPLLTLPAASDLQICSIFTSPLRRAHDTASALFPNAAITVLNELTEISFGEWDGLAWAEIERRDAQFAARKLEDWFGLTPPGGEVHAAILSRASTALDAIRQASHPVAVVAHVGINAVLWQLLTGTPAAEFQQNYLEVKTYESES